MVDLTCMSLIITDMEHLLACWLFIYMSSLEKRLFRSFKNLFFFFFFFFLAGFFGFCFFFFFSPFLGFLFFFFFVELFF